MDLALFDSVAAFLEARLDQTSDHRASSYGDAAYAMKDIEAKVRIMNRAFDAREFVQSFPEDACAQTMFTVYDAVIRHLAEAYDTHPDYERTWRPGGEEWPL